MPMDADNKGAGSVALSSFPKQLLNRITKELDMHFCSNVIQFCKNFS